MIANNCRPSIQDYGGSGGEVEAVNTRFIPQHIVGCAVV
jgi:hypothetical protein